MKIRSIKLKNFRQFFDEQVLTFSTDPEKNISVIHGENGSGKTSLLNAFKWCFYGDTDFDTKQDNILNEHAINVASDNVPIVVSVSVEFEHDGNICTATRNQGYRVLSETNVVKPDGGNVFDLSWTTSDGAYEKSTNPQNQINKILPEGMHSYFLFNGERIEKLAYSSSAGEIRDAIRNLMGLEIMERGRDHLNGKVQKHFHKQISEGASGKLLELVKKEEELDTLIEELKHAYSTETKNITGYDVILEELQAKLKLIEGVSALQKRRETANKLLGEKTTELQNNQKYLKSEIGNHGFLAFLSGPASEVAKTLEARRKKGELPYAIKRQFIDDLLAQKTCICGTDLLPASSEYLSVSAYREKASPEGIEEAFTRTSGALGQYESSRDNMFSRLKERLSARKSLMKAISDLEGELDEISGKVKDSDIEDANVLESKIQENSRLRDEAIAARAKLEGQIEENQEKLKEIVKDRKDMQEKSEMVELAERRCAVVEEAASVLDQLHVALAEQTKEKLSERVNATFQKILKKDYWAEIDENYTLRVLKKSANGEAQIVHEKSTGESQVTSLSFIASIIDYAREQTHKNKPNSFLKGGVFPIVMDSPFGALDPDYRKLIARHIPELAQQIIIMVSKSQWDGEVQEECEKRVGKQISLVYHAPSIREGLESPQIVSGAEFEHTQVAEGYIG